MVNNETDYVQLVDFFKSLGDYTRLRIILELTTKKCVGELADNLNMTHSAISHQLNILKAKDIVKSERQGKYIYYTLNNVYLEHTLEKFQYLFVNDISL